MESARQKRDQQLSRLVGDVRERKFPYEPPPANPIDWASYTQAQVEEINDTLVLIRETVDATPEPPPPRSRKGRTPEYSAHDLAKALLVQQYHQASNRLAQGYARLYKEKLGLDRVPHYKAIERAYEDPRVRKVLDDVFALTQEPERGHVQGFTLDGSGLPRDVRGNWARDKESQAAKKERFDGAVAMLTLPHLITTAHVARIIGFENECPTLKPLVEQTVAHYGSLTGPVCGDAAFLSRANTALIHRWGGTPRIFPKRNATLNPGGDWHGWRRMLDTFLDHTQAWLEDYHQRSLSETAWSRHKRRHPKPLARRLDRRRGTERHTRFTIDNLTRLATLRRLGEVTIPWLAAWAA